jgi:hypothetical protein
VVTSSTPMRLRSVALLKGAEPFLRSPSDELTKGR